MTAAMKEKLIHGDSFDILKEMEPESIDSVVTDPPYGLSTAPNIREVLTTWLGGNSYTKRHKGFMGAEWDAFIPEPPFWKEVYRVLKPGGHAMVFASPKTQHLMTLSLMLGGFQIRDVIEWLYFNGFPKGADVGKLFDKRNGRTVPDDDFRDYLKTAMKKRDITRKQLEQALGTNGMAGHYLGKSQPEYPTPEKWRILKDLLGLDDRYDDIIERVEAEREIIGTQSAQRTKSKSIGLPTTDEKAVRKTWYITAPSTEKAKQWNGWKTMLKPAHEPVILMRKPIKHSLVDTVDTYGTGAINIEGCRIGERFPANIATTEPDAFWSPFSNVSQHKASKKAKEDRHETASGARMERKNAHATVKPIELMKWLVRLITPPDGVVLDPFAGSGTTAVAAKREGFGYIAIEREQKYYEIMRERMEIDKRETVRT